jgi:hypothetical protein
MPLEPWDWFSLLRTLKSLPHISSIDLFARTLQPSGAPVARHSEPRIVILISRHHGPDDLRDLVRQGGCRNHLRLTHDYAPKLCIGGKSLAHDPAYPPHRSDDEQFVNIAQPHFADASKTRLTTGGSLPGCGSSHAANFRPLVNVCRSNANARIVPVVPDQP